MKFFRSSRIKAMQEKALFKYIFYAIGEILIVVIGILIAVQLNNKNTDKIANENISKYIDRINDEIETHTQVILPTVSYTQDSIIPSLLTARRIVKNGELDSLQFLAKGIELLTNNEAFNFTLPVLDEFIRKGYFSHIDNEELNTRFWFYNYCKNQCHHIDEEMKLNQINLIKPFLIKNLRYSNYDSYAYTSKTNENKEKELQKLLNNVEFENIISLYISHSESFAWNFQQLNKSLEQINDEIQKINLN